MSKTENQLIRTDIYRSLRELLIFSQLWLLNLTDSGSPLSMVINQGTIDTFGFKQLLSRALRVLLQLQPHAVVESTRAIKQTPCDVLFDLTKLNENGLFLY